jgi:hypothetical protein
MKTGFYMAGSAIKAVFHNASRRCRNLAFEIASVGLRAGFPATGLIRCMDWVQYGIVLLVPRDLRCSGCSAQRAGETWVCHN